MGYLKNILIFVALSLCYSCNTENSTNDNTNLIIDTSESCFEVTLTDSVIIKHFIEYIDKKTKDDTLFEKGCIFTLCVERDFNFTRYFISYNTIPMIKDMSLDYYSYLNNNLLIIYLSQYPPIPHDMLEQFQGKLFLENKAYNELFNKEKKRFTENSMIFTEPDGVIITKCAFKDTVIIEYTTNVVEFLKNKNQYNNTICPCLKGVSMSN